jgi:fibrillarin-like pre-rRNA processing protein
MNANTHLFRENLRFIRKGRKLFTDPGPGERPRYWNPVHSKLSALLGIKPSLEMIGIHSILYLGGGHGTTVSHLSDLLPNGKIFVVEFGITIDEILTLADARKNVFPFMEDASNPRNYSGIIPKGSIDLLYQDIAQRHQVDILLANMKFLRKGGYLMLMLKTRSISQDLKPSDIAKSTLMVLSKRSDIGELELVDLKPYQKDHFAIFGKLK